MGKFLWTDNYQISLIAGAIQPIQPTKFPVCVVLGLQWNLCKPGFNRGDYSFKRCKT